MTVKEHLELCAVSNKKMKDELDAMREKFNGYKADSISWKKRALKKRDELDAIRKVRYFDLDNL